MLLTLGLLGMASVPFGPFRPLIVAHAAALAGKQRIPLTWFVSPAFM